jgi:hypothetical protein
LELIALVNPGTAVHVTGDAQLQGKLDGFYQTKFGLVSEQLLHNTTRTDENDKSTSKKRVHKNNVMLKVEVTCGDIQDVRLKRKRHWLVFLSSHIQRKVAFQADRGRRRPGKLKGENKGLVDATSCA